MSVSVLFFKNSESGGIDRLLDCTLIMSGILIKKDDVYMDLYISMLGSPFAKFKYETCATGVTLTSSTEIYFFYKSQEVIVDIDTTEDERQKVTELCDACCKLKRGYNYWDKFISTYLPLVPIIKADVDIFSAPSLHTSQAVMLILRASLQPDHPICVSLMGINSRGMYSTCLHRILTKNASPRS